MKWQGRRQSTNIQDRRRMGGRGGAIGGVGGLGVLAIVVIGWFLGVDVSPILDGGQQMPTGQSRELTAAEQQEGEFVAVTLADTEDVWDTVLPEQAGIQYRPPQLVLFSGGTQSDCGGASAVTGPFYCPIDGMIYLDTQFFTVMDRQLGAGGDFAAAYVVAHEVAHAVQDQLGILDQTMRLRQRSSEADANRISVMTELQADCFSGIFARYAQDALGTLEAGDIREALNAARQIGDDTLQRNAGQRVQPHTFTHGTSEQRQRWFDTGFQTADMGQCNTFEARSL
ncbi:KPN_02809 family neutral zinc metallopeptidase [Marivivens aquimaris]|uniref:KPN_02809 family neutral zinc metallopeptidase n=1 Tax=Marivivens aquimaris TaxID=2774876 RepID=UPI001882C3A8|nr:neutral zinc metallopeptidase [Marivivens aquimaris]